MMSRRLKPILFCAILLFQLPGAASADKHIVEQVTLKAASDDDGSSEQGRTAEVHTWFGTQRYARIDGLNNTTTIVRRDKGKIYLILHAEKLVVEADFPFALPRQLRPLFEEVRMDWQLALRDETRQIRNLPCRKAVLRGRGALSVDVEMWVTSEAEIDARTLYPFVVEALKPLPIYRGMAERLGTLGRAISLLTVTTTTKLGLSTTVTEEVQSITEEPAPIGLYNPPDDYNKEPFNFRTYLVLVRELSAF